MRERKLTQYAPRFAEIFRAEDLGTICTPIVREGPLAAALGLGDLWVKRDDASHPAYGGSKVRALEMHLGAARGRSKVFTVGPWGSHHVVATAVFAPRCGLSVQALLVPQPESSEVDGALDRLKDLGVEVYWCPTRTSVPWVASRAAFRARGSLWIPPGGTSPLGVLGLAEAGLELAEALKCGEVPRPDTVVVPVGSAGTIAGLLLGLGLAGLDQRIDGVRVVSAWMAPRWRILRLVGGALRLLERAGDRPAFRWPPFRLWGEALGRGYGHATAEGERVAVMARAEADFRVEPTYSAKALALLLRPEFCGRRVLFHATFSAVDPERGTVPPIA